jgi:phosphoenolpyruvate synthase/pyruvate phosphate dikinase
MCCLPRKMAAAGTKKWVYNFTEGDRNQVPLLGGKGAYLAEMIQIGLPVPPGYVVTTEACMAYQVDNQWPAGLAEQVCKDFQFKVGSIQNRWDTHVGSSHDGALGD